MKLPTQKQLKEGEVFQYSNEDWCIENEIDTPMEAEVWYDGEDSGLPNWARGFKIMFNGHLKTYKSHGGIIHFLQDFLVRHHLTEQTELV